MGDGADFVAVIDEREGEVLGGKFGSEVGGLETDFVEIIFILHKNEVSVKSFDLIKSPSIEQEMAVAEGVFEAISGEVGGFVVGDREEFVVGDFTRKDTVFFELAGDGFGFADDFAGVFLDGFLGFGITVHVVDSVFEGGRGNVMEETGEGLFFVLGEAPDDEGDTDTVLKNGVEVLELEDTAVIDAVYHADAGEALELGGDDVFQEPGRKIRTEDFEVLTGFEGERFQGLVFASCDVEGFVGMATEEAAFFC